MMAGVLTGDEMSHLTEIISRPLELSTASKALTDYINTIKTEKLASGRGEAPDAEDLKKLSERLRQSKGYGRNNNNGN